MKLVQANIMVDKVTWDEFRKVAKENEDSASQILRRYMKQYVKQNTKTRETK